MESLLNDQFISSFLLPSSGKGYVYLETQIPRDTKAAEILIIVEHRNCMKIEWNTNK